MKEVTLTVSKAGVYEEVAKGSNYTGAKMVGDEGAYERIFVTDEDRLLLERFWVEACSAATAALRPFLVAVSAQPESHGVDLSADYVAELELSSMFDDSLSDSMQGSLFSYFVAALLSKWYKYANKPEAESYGVEALGYIEDVVRKAYWRKKPTRIVPQ